LTSYGEEHVIAGKGFHRYPLLIAHKDIPFADGLRMANHVPILPVKLLDFHLDTQGLLAGAFSCSILLIDDIFDLVDCG
jgi:hypothetical protein